MAGFSFPEELPNMKSWTRAKKLCARARARALLRFYQTPRPRCYQNNPRCQTGVLETGRKNCVRARARARSSDFTKLPDPDAIKTTPDAKLGSWKRAKKLCARARARARALLRFYQTPRPRCYQNNPTCQTGVLETGQKIVCARARARSSDVHQTL